MKSLTQLEVWIEGDDDPEITYDEVHSTCIEPGQRKIVNIACTVDDMLDPDPDDDLFHVLDGEYSGIGGIATHHFRARSYDPEAGIRLSTDPAGQFFNAYSYVGGNPICLTDPTGEPAPLAAAFIEGAMFTYAASMGFHALLCLEGAITGEIHYIDVNQLFASTLAGGFFGWGGSGGLVGANFESPLVRAGLHSTLSSSFSYVISGGERSIATTIGPLTINWDPRERFITIANPGLDQRSLLHDFMEIGGYWSVVGEFVRRKMIYEENLLKQELGEGYDLYKFAQKVERLTNPPDNWFGRLTGSKTWYGRFLGPGDAGPREFLDVLGPRDYLDFGAQKHDKRYQAASGPTGGGYTAMFNPEVSGADFMLSYDFLTAPLRGPLYNFWGAVGPLLLGVPLYPTLGVLKLAPYVEPAL